MTVKRTLMRGLPRGADLYDSLTEIVQRENITLGRIQAIGATTHAVVAYYDQNAKKYNHLEIAGGMEILGCSGNVSLRDGRPFVHAHILLGGPDGRVAGGHLLPGTRLLAGEVCIDELEGERLERSLDEGTGLYLWKSESLL